MATGWLGWSPSVAWSTPIPEIMCAFKAHVDYVKQTNPYGSPEEEKPKDKGSLAKSLLMNLRAAGAPKPKG